MDWKVFFAVPPNLTIWSILNSQFLTTVLAGGLGVLALRFQEQLRQARESEEAANEALKVKSQVEERRQSEPPLVIEPANEAAPAPAAAQIEPQVADFRAQASEYIAEAKQFLRDQVTKDTDQRRQRTYSKISWHYPEEMAFALYDRDKLSEQQYSAAFDMFELWRPFSRGVGSRRPVSPELSDRLRILLHQLRRD